MSGSRLDLLILMVVTAGCNGPGGDPDAGFVDFDCELGAALYDGGFDAISTDGGRLELDLGFQGLLFVTLQVRAVDPPETTMNGSMSLDVDGHDPVGATQNAVVFSSRTDGYSYSAELVVFLEPPQMGEFESRTADVSVRMRGAENQCTVSGVTLLVDDDPCIHTGEEPICP